MIIELNVSRFSYKIIKKQYHSDIISPRRASELHDILQFSQLNPQNYKNFKNFNAKQFCCTVSISLNSSDAAKLKANCFSVACYLDRFYKRMFKNFVSASTDKNSAVYLFFNTYNLDEKDYKIASALKFIQRDATKNATDDKNNVQKLFRKNRLIILTPEQINTMYDNYIEKNSLLFLSTKKTMRTKLCNNAKIYIYHNIAGYSIAFIAKEFKISRSTAFRSYKSFENEFRHQVKPCLKDLQEF